MKILVSRCLLGNHCRYDGLSSSNVTNTLLDAGFGIADIIPICPETDGGLSTPRSPSEIQEGTGIDVLSGRAKVRMKCGTDCTQQFINGANWALRKAQETGTKIALLKSKSPSCGIGQIYDGTFSGVLTAGDGVTVALLKKHGIHVVSEKQITTLFLYKEDGNERDC